LLGGGVGVDVGASPSSDLGRNVKKEQWDYKERNDGVKE